jgi:hypothetical protein
MKHLLSGTALAAAMVLAAPVWAQTNSTMTRSSTAPAASTAAPMAPMATERARLHRVRTVRHRTVRRGKARGMAPSDSVANQLNAQEAARRGGGGPSPMGAATGPYGQPNQIQGMPGAGQPSASSHMPEGPGPAYVPGQRQASPSPNAPSGPSPAYVPGQYQPSPSPNAPSPTR